MNEKEVSEFEQVQTQLQGFYKEISGFATKKPDDAINTFKLKLINQVLKRANALLSKRKPFSDFNQFASDNLPSNSDVVVVISQYINSLEKIRADNIESRSGYWFWVIDGEISDIRTAEPKKIRN
ncbi:MAG: hypothetical protein QY306_16645 [Anaerolineales bacterium]|nr:MAG: hypothetical protein QY306_16645 [Anaerolineales bacterium]